MPRTALPGRPLARARRIAAAIVLMLAAVTVTAAQADAAAVPVGQPGPCPRNDHGGDLFMPIGPGPVPAGGSSSKTITVGTIVTNRSESTAVAKIYYVGSDGQCRFVDDQSIPPGGSGRAIVHTPSESYGAIWIWPAAAGADLDASFNHIVDDVRPEVYGSIATTEAIHKGSAEVNLPLLMNDNSGVSTWVGIQNTDATRKAKVLITYHANGQDYTSSKLLEPLASVRIDQAAQPVRATTDEHASKLPKVFSGTIKGYVNDTDDPLPVAAVVMQEAPNGLASYAGFAPDASAKLVSAPVVMANNGPAGNAPFTGVQIQNTSARVADITISYSKNIGLPGQGIQLCGDRPDWRPADKTIPGVKPGESVTFIQHGGDEAKGFDNQFTKDGADCRWVGSSRIKAEESAFELFQPGLLVGIVNQVGPRMMSSYAALSQDQLGEKTFVPLVNVSTSVPGNPAIITGINVQNKALGTHDEVVVITFGENVAKRPEVPDACTEEDGRTPLTPTPIKRTVTAEEVGNFLLGVETGDPDTTYREFIGCTYVGSATVNAASKPYGLEKQVAAVVVNQMSYWNLAEGLGSASIHP